MMFNFYALIRKLQIHAYEGQDVNLVFHDAVRPLVMPYCP